MLLEYSVLKIDGKDVKDDDILVKKEWISERNHRDFPIEIEIRLKNPSEIEKIELVAHSKFIPTKIAISSEKSDDDGYIGELEFRKARSGDAEKNELKNIFLDEKCDVLFLHVFEPHVDIIDNLNSQVGIKELKFFGKYISSSPDEPLIEGSANKIEEQKYSKEISAMIESIDKNKQTAVANEDFKFAKMAQLATRQLKKSHKEMEELERDKEEAIESEDFQRAEDLQDEITTLRSNVMASIDPILLRNTMPREQEIHRPKNLFPENEAPLMTPSKPKLYQPIDLSPTEIPADPSHTFLLPPRPSNSRPSSKTSFNSRPSSNTRPPSRSRPSSNSRPPSNPRPASNPKFGSRSSTPVSNPRSSPIPRPPSKNEEQSYQPESFIQKRPNTVDSLATRRSSSSSSVRRTGTNKFLEKENMIVPAALNRKRSNSVNLETSSEFNSEDAQQPLSKTDDLTEEQLLNQIPPDNRQNVRAAISVFGIDTMRKLYSKHFQNRKDGLEEVNAEIDEMSYDKISKNFEAINCLIAHLLKEPLYNVYKSVLLLWHHFVTEKLPSEKSITRVSAETSDTFATRVLSNDRRLTTDTLKTFRDAGKLQHVAKSYSNRLLSSTSKNLKGRAILLDSLVKLHGVPNDLNGLTSNLLAPFATKCIRTSDQQTRTIGKDILIKLYKNGAESDVQKELNKFESSDSNNPTYQKIRKEIWNMNGGRTKNSKKKISFML